MPYTETIWNHGKSFSFPWSYASFTVSARYTIILKPVCFSNLQQPEFALAVTGSLAVETRHACVWKAALPGWQMLAGGKSTYQRLVKERVSKSIEDWSPSILKHGPTSSWYSCIAYKWKVKMRSRINQSSKILVRTLFIPRLEMNRSATNRFSTSYRGIWRSGRFAGLSSICRFSWFLVSLSSCLFLAPASLSFPFFSCFFLFYSLCLLFPFYPFFLSLFHVLFLTFLLLVLAPCVFAACLVILRYVESLSTWHRKCSRAD